MHVHNLLVDCFMDIKEHGTRYMSILSEAENRSAESS